MIELSTDIWSRFESSSNREWLETNGIGGYASSSVSGANTRRYHGLLVASTRPPLGRMVLLSKFEETLIVDGERFEISSNQYPGAVSPKGYEYLVDFSLDPFPVWIFNIEGIEVERTIFMVYGENTTVCRWKINNPSEILDLRSEIELKPLLAFRDHHHLRHVDVNFEGEYVAEAASVSITPYAEMPTLHFAHNAEKIEKQGFWYRNFEYAIERERGFDHHEDLFQPFSLRIDLADEAVVIASTEPKRAADADGYRKSEMKRQGNARRGGREQKMILLRSLCLRPTSLSFHAAQARP